MSGHPAPAQVPSKDASLFRGGQRALAAALGVSLLGWIGIAIGLLTTPNQMLYSYLVNWAYCIGLALGSLCWLMAFHAAKSEWMVVVRRLLEIVASTVLACAFLFLPIALGMKRLYPWVEPDPRRGAHFMHAVNHLQHYLSRPAFLGRALAFFLLFGGLSHVLLRWSQSQDDGRLGVDKTLMRTLRLRQVSSVGLPFVGIAITLGAFDWLMSLDPTWRSTAFGLYYFAGAFAGAMALLIVLVQLLVKEGYFAGLVTGEHRHALGKLLFGFICFWAYIAFAQYMLIWVANLPTSEISYYLSRQREGWAAVSLLLAAGHFLVPFCILLSSDFKKKAWPLAMLAGWILLMHWVDSYWLVMPFLAPSPRLHWQDAAALLGVAGPLVAFGLVRLRGSHVAPVGDPYFEDSIAFHQ